MGRQRKIKASSPCRECRKEHYKKSLFCSDECEKSFKEKAKSIAKLQQMAHAEGLSYGQFVAKYGL